MQNLDFRSTSDIQPKALQIQTATHGEILAIGSDIFKQSTLQQEREFQRRLSDREESLLKQLRAEQDEEMLRLRDQHEEENKQLEKKYIIMQDDALKVEASRVKGIMRKQTTRLVEETKLEGQKRLDEALVKARKEFDVEKAEVISDTIKSEKNIALQEKLKQEEIHEREVAKLNEEWERKLKPYGGMQQLFRMVP